MNKITFFISGLGGGGAEGVCVTLANGLADKGWDINLVVINMQNAVWDSELSNKVHLVDLQKKHARFAIFPIWSYLLKVRPSLVLSFTPELSVIIIVIRFFSCMKFKLISRSPTIFSERNKESKSLWYGFVLKRLLRLIYPLSDVFIALCKDNKEDLEVYLKIDKQKIFIINNPINRKIEDYIKTNVRLENDKENYILCIGRLVPVKAFNYAIEAFARIIVDNPFLRLKILGQGILEKELKQQTKDLNISDKVDFEGYHKDIIPYYLHARLTVLTSLYEGFGCVLNEPIALGTPVVAFDCSGGPKEVIQSGVNGYLVRYKDVDHLTECIKLALNRQWDTKTIRATAGRFSSERIIDEYARVLASVACYQ